MEVKFRFVDNVKILELAGNFDRYNAPLAQHWLESATAKQPVQIVVNLAKVNFMDSSGLSTLVLGLKRSREMKGDLRLCNLQSPVRMVFELTRLDKVFEIFLDEEDAVQAFAVSN